MHTTKTHATKTIGILGAGAWGTALAFAMTRAGQKAVLWMRDADAAHSLQTSRMNADYLPGHVLPDEIMATSQKNDLKICDVILIATPAQQTQQIVASVQDCFKHDVPVLICAKGIEIKTGRLLSQIMTAQCPKHPVGVLTGPSFAAEVANELPTALTLAMHESQSALAYGLCRDLSTPHFRLYASDDMIGVQVGGAVKNVIAIACGIAAGKQMGDNARAALITRGLAEMVRLGKALGAEGETFLGLSGLGDLTLTCNAMQSRNFSLGVEIGQGGNPQIILAERNTVAEGAYTAEAVSHLAHHLNIDMPITQAVYETLSGTKSIDYVIKGLLGRPVTTENP